jgi:hypothetical protein
MQNIHGNQNDLDHDLTDSTHDSLKAEELLTYIRPLKSIEGRGFAVCSESGEVMGVFGSHEAAYFAARQFHFEPQYIH